MGNVSPAQPSLREHWAAGRKATGGIRRSLRWSLIGCVVVVALIGTYFFGKARTLAEARGEIAGSAQGAGEASMGGGSFFGPESLWTIQTTNDPMTDASVRQASATFEGNQFNFKVGVSCSSTGDILYTATAFDKDDQTAEMRIEAVTIYGEPGIRYQMRADSNQVKDLVQRDPDYNNQITLKSTPVQFYMGKPIGDNNAEEMAAASKILLRLFMPTGEETIEWSQTDAALRNLMSPCLSQRQAERDRLTAEQAKKEREEAVEQLRNPPQQVNAM